MKFSGGCILASVDSTREFFITSKEWEAKGLMAVKQKGSFVWPY